MIAYRITVSNTSFTMLARNAKDLFDRLADMEEFRGAPNRESLSKSERSLEYFSNYGSELTIVPQGEVV